VLINVVKKGQSDGNAQRQKAETAAHAGNGGGGTPVQAPAPVAPSPIIIPTLPTVAPAKPMIITAHDRSSATASACRYSTNEATVSGKAIKEATVISKESIEFSFLYGEPQYPRLIVRTHPRYGNNIIISIDRGQFMCSVIHCTVIARFDNGQPQTFIGLEPEDNSTTAVFIRDYGRFLNELKKTKVLKIEAVFFHEGPRQMEFDVAGFDPR
jgi:hypothetical protein